MVNVTGWGFGSEKTESVEVFAKWRFLTWLDDASDVAVVLWALLLLILMATLSVPPFPQDPREGGTSAWETLWQGSSSAGRPAGASPGLGGGRVSVLPLAELWRQGWAGRCCGSMRETQPAPHHPPCPVPCSSSLPSPTAAADLHQFICCFGECLLCTPINIIALFCWREC